MIGHPLYRADIAAVAALPLPWERLAGTTLLVAGARGLVGSFLIDVLMHLNRESGLNCRIIAMGRDVEKGQAVFAPYWSSPCFSFLAHDVNTPLPDHVPPAQHVLHLASNTHPRAYATDPIGTIASNIIGTNNLLGYAARSKAVRFLFASSNEIYGENRGDVEQFAESYCGYIDSNTLRAGYPESKRCGEALCQAYRVQRGLPVVIARLTRSFGPTLLSSDTKALSQFLRNAVATQDIVLKSKGEQFYSYTYVADAVSGLLTVLLLGADGEAYNVADASCDIRLKDLAQMLAELAGTRVVFELPDAVEAAGFSKATKARLDGTKLRSLGWHPLYSLKAGLERTLTILRAGG